MQNGKMHIIVFYLYDNEYIDTLIYISPYILLIMKDHLMYVLKCIYLFCVYICRRNMYGIYIFVIKLHILVTQVGKEKFLSAVFVIPTDSLVKYALFYYIMQI